MKKNKTINPELALRHMRKRQRGAKPVVADGAVPGPQHDPQADEAQPDDHWAGLPWGESPADIGAQNGASPRPVLPAAPTPLST